MNNLKEIIEAIKSGTIEYGDDKDYMFMTDEDGLLFFLKRNKDITLDEEGEPRECWSQYDDHIIWKTSTNGSRGLDVTEMFLKALEIEFIG